MEFKKNLPNYLTYFRIVIIPVFVGAFYLGGDWGYWLSAGLFMIAGITDWLDGYTARLWQVESNVGKFLDPIADKLLVATALLLLVGEHRDGIADGQAMMIPAIAIVCREILVSGLREFLAEIRIGMPVSRLAKWKTAAQMGAIFMLLLGGGGPGWMFAGYVGNALLWAAAILTLITGYAYVRTGWKHL
ncbi:MAG: CDP-diacylglycerol--glycerol-3-phosphate 3-phosphatidyltransferase [Rickettsiales bacterium]